jgi:hypothetical protein
LPNVIITLEYGNGQSRDLGLPMDVSCRALSTALYQALKINTDVGEGITLVEQDGAGGRRLAANATLGDLGILHGTRLTLVSERAKEARAIPQGGASLRLDNGNEIPLSAAYMLIGRRDPKHNIFPDFDLSELDTTKISSRQHAAIEFDQRNYVVKDLRSVNGTWLNGVRLTPEVPNPVNDGDEIYFGRNGVRVKFRRGA